MIKYEFQYVAFVTEEGTYGVDHVVTFDADKFIEQYPDAWDLLDNMADSDKQEFILAVLNQDEVQLRDFAIDYEFDIKDVLD